MNSGQCLKNMSFERLKRLVPAQHIAIRELKIGMIGESMVDKRAAPIYKAAQGVETTILAGTPGEVQLHPPRTSQFIRRSAKARGRAALRCSKMSFEDAIFATKGESMEQIVGYYLGMARKDAGRGRVLHRRHAGGKDHVDSRQFALLPRRSGGFTRIP